MFIITINIIVLVDILVKSLWQVLLINGGFFLNSIILVALYSSNWFPVSNSFLMLRLLKCIQLVLCERIGYLSILKLFWILFSFIKIVSFWMFVLLFLSLLWNIPLYLSSQIYIFIRKLPVSKLILLFVLIFFLIARNLLLRGLYLILFYFLKNFVFKSVINVLNPLFYTVLRTLYILHSILSYILLMTLHRIFSSSCFFFWNLRRLLNFNWFACAGSYMFRINY